MLIHLVDKLPRHNCSILYLNFNHNHLLDNEIYKTINYFQRDTTTTFLIIIKEIFVYEVLLFTFCLFVEIAQKKEKLWYCIVLLIAEGDIDVFLLVYNCVNVKIWNMKLRPFVVREMFYFFNRSIVFVFLNGK